MNILVTGGAGFIGRWVVKELLDREHDVWIVDNLSNGKLANIIDLLDHPFCRGFIEGDIKDYSLLQGLFKYHFNVCYHLAASINVQDSIDDPRTTYDNDATGTLNMLEACKSTMTRMVFMSTCMVYDTAHSEKGIDEDAPLKAASPYAAAKLAGEFLTQSYHYAYGLPAVVIRPFNTYGPYQKSSGEGGVVAIFIQKELDDEIIPVYGDGTQTRDLLYVEDCARFVVDSGLNPKADGQIINAGTGRDISVNDLARLISSDPDRIKHVLHIHPQSEIQKLLCDPRRAKKVLGWEPQYTLEEGIAKTREWIAANPTKIEDYHHKHVFQHAM